MIASSELHNRVLFNPADTLVLLPHLSKWALMPIGPGAASINAAAGQPIIIYPNPWRPNSGNPALGLAYREGIAGTGISFVLPQGNFQIDIYNIVGEKVFSKNVDITLPTSGVWQWSANNTNNEEVASGMYIAVIKGNGVKKIAKFSIIR